MPSTSPDSDTSTPAGLDEARVLESRDAEREHELAFGRTETRHTRLKRLCDCGHVIDGSEPYTYSVWKTHGDQQRGVEQLVQCEPCSVSDGYRY
jgi:hypothetical protein